MDAAWVAAWAAVATTVIYIVLGVVAFIQVTEAKALRRQQTRPYVIVDFAFQRWVIYLEVRNIGSTPARNVSIAFDQPLVSTLEGRTELDESVVFRKPIPMMAPGRSIKVLFDVAHQRLNRTDLPLAYTVTCKYEDMRGQKYDDPAAVLDLSTYEGSSLEAKALPELVDEVEKVRRELAKWTNSGSGGGIFVQAVDRNLRVRRQDRWHWMQTGKRVRKDKGWRSYLSWVIKRFLRRFGWLR